MSASNLITAAEFDRSVDTIGKGANLPTVYAESYRYVLSQVCTHRNLDAATRMFSAISKAPALPSKCSVLKFTSALTDDTGGVVQWTGPKGAKVASMEKGANLPAFDTENDGRFWEVEKDEGSKKTPEERLLAALDQYAKKQGSERLAKVLAVHAAMQAAAETLATIGK